MLQPEQPEQDDAGIDGLPTYEDLAAQKGPNSRQIREMEGLGRETVSLSDSLDTFLLSVPFFSAAERYLDITPEERVRRRERGWGNDGDQFDGENEQDVSKLYSTQVSATNSQWSGNTVQQPIIEPPLYFRGEPEAPIPTTGESLLPSHLQLHHFGSKFLPHTTWQINALLPLMGDRLLLIGHDNGLSVLDMFPSGDPRELGPADAQVRSLWEGEGVYQLELLEFQDTGDVTPLGVVLALIGSEVESNAKPVDLRRPSNWSPQQATTKKHKHNSSIVKLKLFISDAQQNSEPQSSYSRYSNVPIKRVESASSVESSWDMIEELPLRWATDFVPLASAGSRLLNSNVLFFELKKREVSGLRGPSLLALATKQSILLYETPKGERAFRFVKEFYAPLQPRNLSFVQQRVQETVVVRSPSSSSQRSDYGMDNDSGNRRFSIRQSLDVTRERERSASPIPDYGAQLSLFVVFDKKAGLIRLSDSAVGEVELSDDSLKDLYSPLVNSPRKSLMREHKGYWLPPTYEELPIESSGQTSTLPVYLLTRGKQTHVLASPLPASLSNCPPLSVLMWQHLPNQVCHRVCSPLAEPDFLQVIGFGEFGVEVQEIPLSSFSKGKGKSRSLEPIRAKLDIGGDVGFLCKSGQWHKPHRFLSRDDSFMSYNTTSTVRPETRDVENGFYGWLRRDVEDWRLFWIGGMEKDDN
ncbi:hypothetical protein EW145_g628 [Phellinidium pouzarii]|uniref:Uncharacterized protein n=1 Tax=Phellinidium pouzarii TaxID=167371 RepID=A0A4S4LJF2_9AGAM|nr:hypothetical protein EW145_g628 [Phellinidium pouzarii]